MNENYDNYLDFYKYLVHVELLASNTIKNEAKTKIRNLFRINLKYSSKFLAHKKTGHTGTPANVQNNCIKSSGFGADISQLFLHREIMRNSSYREKFFNPKILSQVFRRNLTYFFLLHIPNIIFAVLFWTK